MGVLTGIRVLDFGRYVAGPYCATLLGYLGAEVIRIEKPDGGEDRYIAPVSASGEGGVFFQTACNKKSLTLDPAAPRGREIVARLVATADVVVANLPPATLAALGLDYQSLRRIKPDIILASQTAFGDHGPYAELGGFDGVGQAMSGAMYITGTPGAPVKAAAPYVDFSTAVLSALGTLAALMHRERTGEGQEVATSLLGTALSVFASHLIEQGVTHRDRIGTGNRVQTSAPSDVFPTRDGHVLIHVVGNPLFRRWARLVGEERRWIDDPAYANDALRGANSARDARAHARLVRRAHDAGGPRGTAQRRPARGPRAYAANGAGRCPGCSDGIPARDRGFSGPAPRRARARSAGAPLTVRWWHRAAPAAARRAHRRDPAQHRHDRARDRRPARATHHLTGRTR